MWLVGFASIPAALNGLATLNASVFWREISWR